MIKTEVPKPPGMVQEFAEVVNLVGRRVDLRMNRRGDDVIVSLEPAKGKKIPRVVQDWPKTSGELFCQSDSIEMLMAGESYVEGLPRPKAGVIYVVSEGVARHPKVRRRRDVFFPYAPNTGATVFSALSRG